MTRKFTKYPQNITAAIDTSEITIGKFLTELYETRKLIADYTGSADWDKLINVYADARNSGDTAKIIQLYDVISKMRDAVSQGIDQLKQNVDDIGIGNYRKPKG